MDASFLTSSNEAGERLKREKYHAVFLDMRMPAPDGAELARQIRASRVNASTVIVVTLEERIRSESLNRYGRVTLRLRHAAFAFLFFSALYFAQRSFVAFEIFARAAADITRFLP